MEMRGLADGWQATPSSHKSTVLNSAAMIPHVARANKDSWFTGHAALAFNSAPHQLQEGEQIVRRGVMLHFEHPAG